MLSRKIINIYNDTAQKYENVTVKGFQKYEKLEYKKNKFYNDVRMWKSIVESYLDNYDDLYKYHYFCSNNLT